MITEKKYKDAIVYAWAEFEQKQIGWIEKPHDLGSSSDRYNTEYGWTDEDYKMAQGGKAIFVNYYTVGIDVFSLNMQKNINIAIRLNHPKEKEKKSLDNVIFHKSDEMLLDIGNYGIFNTLTGKKFHKYFFNKESILKLIEKNSHFSSEPFTFIVDGQKFTLKNKMMENRFRIETRIIDNNQRVIMRDDKYDRYYNPNRYYICAVGFPEDILLKKLSKKLRCN